MQVTGWMLHVVVMVVIIVDVMDVLVPKGSLQGRPAVAHLAPMTRPRLEI